MKPFGRLMTASGILLLGMSVAATAQDYVAAAISEDGRSVATVSGTSSKDIGPKAMAACKKKAGKECDYFHWTRSSSHMAMLFCSAVVAGETTSGGVGAHSKKSLADAQSKAFRDLRKVLNRGGYRLKPDDCQVKAVYTEGRFKTY